MTPGASRWWTLAPSVGRHGRRGAIDTAEYASRRIVGIVFVVLAFLTLVFYGLWVASGVVAEKASRVMELLISAATALALFLYFVVCRFLRSVACHEASTSRSVHQLEFVGIENGVAGAEADLRQPRSLAQEHWKRMD